MTNLTVITDNGDVEIEADTWERESDGSRIFYDADNRVVAEFDRENFVAVTRNGGTDE